jgi:hypothetical protein
MKTLFGDVFEILERIETEFRNEYWKIRNARYTDWKAVNRARSLAEFMYLLGVPRWAVKEARYCLRVRVCKRCFGGDLRCHSLSRRAKRGDFKQGED